MEWQRRRILGSAVAVLGSIAWAAPEEKRPMYGLIVKMVAAAGKREALISLLLPQEAMPGCLSYVIARDSADDDGIWITEVWADKASHDASLSLPVVQKTIAAARPMIAVFNNPVVTTPVGGHGLPVAKHAI